MVNLNGDVVFFGKVLRKVLCAVHRAVLATSTSKAEHKVGKLALHIAGNMCICQLINVGKELGNLSVILKELDYLLVQTGKMLEVVIFSRVVDCAAVKNISSTVSAVVNRNTLFV